MTDDKTLRLLRDGEGLYLTDGTLTLRGDLTHMLPRIRPGRLQTEMLIKAVRIKGKTDSLRVIDATAGLGEDSLILAAAGFRVDMYEYDPVIAALLEDAVEKAKGVPELKEAVGLLTLHKEDSVAAMRALDFSPDVVLLDPMFPGRQKSALIKKKFQLLQQLETPCSNEEELLAAAMAAGPRKIVIKRPLKGPYLAGRKPDHSYAGKAVRYDCVLVNRPMMKNDTGDISGPLI